LHEWRSIHEFLGYSVSDTGSIRNDDTDRIMKLTTNSQGVVIVGLMKGKRQFKRSVPLLVASAFRPQTNEHFDTPMHLDGDRQNNHACNLIWRPLWFTRKYNQQLEKPAHVTRPIEELETGSLFKNALEAAMAYGLLEMGIIMALDTHQPVWPTEQCFRALD